MNSSFFVSFLFLLVSHSAYAGGAQTPATPTCVISSEQTLKQLTISALDGIAKADIVLAYVIRKCSSELPVSPPSFEDSLDIKFTISGLPKNHPGYTTGNLFRLIMKDQETQNFVGIHAVRKDVVNFVANSVSVRYSFGNQKLYLGSLQYVETLDIATGIEITISREFPTVSMSL